MSEIITTIAGHVDIFDAKTQERVRTILEAGTADNTRRAYQGDLRYFWGWARVALGLGEAYPVPLAVLVRFVTDHLEGLPEPVDAALVAERIKARLGTHSLATVARRLAALSVVHGSQGVDNPIHMPQIRALLASARRARARQGQGPKKKQAATLDVLEAMLATCQDDIRGVRDRALLLFAFASGGRRRSEVAGAVVENLTVVPGGFLYRIPWSKTDQEGVGREVPVLGRAAKALENWLKAASLDAGAIFRAISPAGVIEGRLSARGINRIVKRLAAKADFDPANFGAHSLRSGFVTEAGRRGVPRNEAMAMTGHRSGTVFDEYFRVGSILRSSAANIAE
jgi:integrase